MKKVVMFFVDLFRKAKHYISTFLLKCQLVEYGDNVGAAKIIRISRQAKVSVGHNCAFELQEKGIPRHGYEIADAEGKNW